MHIDPRENYLKNVDINSSSVSLHPPIVILLGGSIENDSETFRKKIIDFAVVDPHLSSSIFAPENFQDWLHDGLYEDLLLFETDLIGISTLTVLILESQGALAELGTIATQPDFCNKVFVVVEKEHYDSDSYIKYGPLRRFNEDNVLVFPVSLSNGMTAEKTDALTSTVTLIKEFVDRSHKTEKFNAKSNAHIALLICELILLFQALSVTEIRDFLKLLKVDCSQVTVKKILFLLQKVRLIYSNQWGQKTFYLPVNRDVPARVKFTMNPGANQFDRTSVIFGTTQFYQGAEKEADRRKVMRGSEQ